MRRRGTGDTAPPEEGEQLRAPDDQAEAEAVDQAEADETGEADA